MFFYLFCVGNSLKHQLIGSNFFGYMTKMLSGTFNFRRQSSNASNFFGPRRQIGIKFTRGVQLHQSHLHLDASQTEARCRVPEQHTKHQRSDFWTGCKMEGCSMDGSIKGTGGGLTHTSDHQCAMHSSQAVQNSEWPPEFGLGRDSCSTRSESCWSRGPAEPSPR
jgi:hypothetical protein